MDLLHAVKDRQCDLCCTLDMVFAAGITFCNISGSYQNIIFEVMDTLDKFFLLTIIISNSVKKRNSGNPDSLRLKNIQKVLIRN